VRDRDAAIHCGGVALDSREGSPAARPRRSYGDAVAIETESAGATQAAHLNDRLPVLSVRGISDRADGAKHEADREGQPSRR
jgi:nucleoside phosphorylase